MVSNTAVQCLTAMIPSGPGSKSHIPRGYVFFSVRTGQQQNRTYERATMVSQHVLSKFEIIITCALEKYTYLASSYLDTFSMLPQGYIWLSKTVLL
jgi:hypothetical protein